MSDNLKKYKVLTNVDLSVGFVSHADNENDAMSEFLDTFNEEISKLREKGFSIESTLINSKVSDVSDPEKMEGTEDWEDWNKDNLPDQDKVIEIIDSTGYKTECFRCSHSPNCQSIKETATGSRLIIVPEKWRYTGEKVKDLEFININKIIDESFWELF